MGQAGSGEKLEVTGKQMGKQWDQCQTLFYLFIFSILVSIFFFIFKKLFILYQGIAN